MLRGPEMTARGVASVPAQPGNQLPDNSDPAQQPAAARRPGLLSEEEISNLPKDMQSYYRELSARLEDRSNYYKGERKQQVEMAGHLGKWTTFLIATANQSASSGGASMSPETCRASIAQALYDHGHQAATGYIDRQRDPQIAFSAFTTERIAAELPWLFNQLGDWAENMTFLGPLSAEQSPEQIALSKDLAALRTMTGSPPAQSIAARAAISLLAEHTRLGQAGQSRRAEHTQGILLAILGLPKRQYSETWLD